MRKKVHILRGKLIIFIQNSSSRTSKEQATWIIYTQTDGKIKSKASPVYMPWRPIYTFVRYRGLHVF